MEETNADLCLDKDAVFQKLDELKEGFSGMRTSWE